MAGSNEFKPRHAHELEAAGEPRWSARIKDGLLMVTDNASGIEVQSTAHTVDGSAARFQLPGDNGLRELRSDQPGYAEFVAVLQKLHGGKAEVPADLAPAGGSTSKAKAEKA